VSTYTVGAGQLAVGARLSRLDQLDGDTSNDRAVVEINSAPASARVSLRQTVFPPTPRVGELVFFLTEVRNEGPDRVTGLTLLEAASIHLELTTSPNVTGVSGDIVTSIFDSLFRLPPLERGQSFIWQRSYVARSAGGGWREVSVAGFDQTALAPSPENKADVAIQPVQADLELQFLDAPAITQAGIPSGVTVRVRNLGPAAATGARIAITVPADALSLGGFEYGPRSYFVLFEPNLFQVQLQPGESSTVSFHLTPIRTGPVTALISVQQSDQVDPNPANDALSLALEVFPEPPIPPVLHVRKVRTDFFDNTPIAEVVIDQAALNRVAPFTTFNLEASSNLHDWEFLKYVGLVPLAPVTFTDHAGSGGNMRAYRLRRP
jgi:hypothetical protein